MKIQNLMKNIILPQYLDRLKPSKRYYGTIQKKENHWIIKAEPQVMELIRRIFRSTVDDQSGKAVIPCSKRINGDINWFMMRYPLKILTPKNWEKELDTTRGYVRKRMVISTRRVISKTPVDFKGKLYDFQKEGLTFLYNNRRCLLADEMGLGKTVQALAFLSRNGRFPALIIVPPHLLIQWKSETQRFLGKDMKVHIMKGLTPYTLPEADVYLIHYLLLREWYKDLMMFEFDTIIFDEVQELRHRGTKKYRSSDALAQTAKNVIGLSGTPIYNYGIEMFNVMNVIERGCLGTSRYFVKEWCQPHSESLIRQPNVFGRWLREEGLLIRRRKKKVLPQLPPKMRSVQEVSMDNKLYIQLITRSVQLAREIPLAEDREKSIFLMNAVQNSRRATGIAKSQHVAKFTEFLLESKEPCLLFAYHHTVIDLYKKYLAKFNPLCITGRENKKEKAENIRKFMNGDTNILIINLRTTAGLNLQRARCVIFGELDWSPAVHAQAEDRVHRIGQRDSVLAYYLIARTASDMEILACLGLKKEQFSGIMLDRMETEDEKEFSQAVAQKFMWNIVQRLRDTDDKK